MQRRGHNARRRQSGLTLVELLVSMLILGFVLTLVSEAVFQVAQISRSAQAVTAQLSTRWSGGWAAAPMIANLVAPKEVPDDQVLAGESLRLAGYTTQPGGAENTGVRAFTLELRPARDASPRSDLVALDGDGFGTPTTESLIATFEGRVEFAYVDAAGQITPVWPAVTVAANRDVASLPSAVIVRERGSQQPLMWYGFQGETVRPVVLGNPFAPAR